MNIIQEAIEAAATQDLCGNHNSADLLRRLVNALQFERAGADAMARASSIVSYEDRPFVLDDVLTRHAKRREAGE